MNFNLVIIVTNYFDFYKLVSISWFSCSVKSDLLSETLKQEGKN